MIKVKNIFIILFVLAIFSVSLFAGEIHDAAKKGDLIKVKSLLQKDSTLLDTNGENKKAPLHWAAEAGRLEIVEFLIAKGADINILNVASETPLHYAATYGHKEVVDLLLKKGAKVNVIDQSKRTPLFLTGYSGYKDSVKLLLAAGAEVNLKDNRGYSPLRWAALRGHKEIVDMMIAKGADITIHEAAACGHKKMIDTLIAQGIGLDSRDNESGATPLHLAVMAGQNGMIDFLVARGAGINIKNNNGETPLDLAIERGLDEIERLLEAKGGSESPMVPPDVFKLGKHIYRLVFPYSMQSNIGASIGEDGILLVDTGFSRRAVKRIKAVLQKLGNGKIKYVINTHDHWDHVAGNEIGGEGAIVFGCKGREQLVAKGIISPGKGPLKGRTGKTFVSYYTMRFNGEEIRLIPYPGVHSGGDWLIYFTGSGVVNMGDLLLSESFPAVGRNVPAYLEFLEKVIDVFPEKTIFVSGHGKELTWGGVKDYQKMLLTTCEIIKKGLQAGKSAKVMQEEKILKDYENYGVLLKFLGTDSWIRAIAGIYKK
jgi:ankyrin repeat protein/glyoxylase-like metal-dependent hydrolase (beta-lactamase superfamily II)